MYWRVFKTFLQNALVREMTFRGNFLITIVTRGFWFVAQLTLFELIFRSLGPGGEINSWQREEYFAFMATGMLINALVESFFMPNCAQFSELIRTGNLDFALLKPIDTQFLISFEKIDLAMLNQVLLALALLVYSLVQMGASPSPAAVALYLLFIACGVTVFYSLMLVLAASSVWFGRNQGLYDFWFYITVFARYPRSIYSGSPAGEMLRAAFTFVIPILLIVTVPARVLLGKLNDVWWSTELGAMLIIAALAGLYLSRRIFVWSLQGYRSASS